MYNFFKYLKFKIKKVPSLSFNDGGRNLVEYLKHNKKKAYQKRVFLGTCLSGIRSYSNRGYLYEAIRFEKDILLNYLLNLPDMSMNQDGIHIDPHHCEICFKLNDILDTCILWKRWQYLNLIYKRVKKSQKIRVETLALLFLKKSNNGSNLDDFFKTMEKDIYKISFKDFFSLLNYIETQEYNGFCLNTQGANYIEEYFSNNESLKILNKIKNICGSSSRESIQSIINKLQFKENLVI